VITRPGRYQVVKEVLVGDGERRRRYVVCYNPQEAERQAYLSKHSGNRVLPALS
jgi:hypothetical protein